MAERRKIVVDTNVMVSGLLFTGPPREILQMAIQGKVYVCTSTALLKELEGVLERKFSNRKQAITDTLTEIRNLAFLEEPTRRLSVVKEDPDDNRVLECALSARADAIVSGDNHLLRMRRFRDIPIYSPAEFLAEPMAGL